MNLLTPFPYFLKKTVREIGSSTVRGDPGRGLGLRKIIENEIMGRED